MTTESVGVADPVLVAGAAAILSLGVAVTLVGVVWLRRRWRRLRFLLRLGPEAAVVAAGRLAWRSVLDRPRPDRRWRELARSRRRLRQSVSAAEHAVELAASTGAPVGELRSLSRRLRKAADALDASLAADQWSPVRSTATPQTAREVDELLGAAASVHASAAGLLATASGAAQIGLLEDAERELAAVSAGRRTL
jgi:hypothetical protein